MEMHLAKLMDVTGERYGRLVALKFDGVKKGRTWWLFKCDCGAEVARELWNVRCGNTSSCGCLHTEVTKRVKTIHGHRVKAQGKSSRTLKAYQHAKSRCFCPTNNKYYLYGARGITMCAEWANEFSAFLRDMGEAPPGKTLDRIDTNGNYEPGNCRWATPREQSRNLRKNIIVEHEGQRMILKDFAALMGVNYLLLYKRFRRGQTPHMAALALQRSKNLMEYVASD
jgi:hypothetical protein